MAKKSTKVTAEFVLAVISAALVGTPGVAAVVSNTFVLGANAPTVEDTTELENEATEEEQEVERLIPTQEEIGKLKKAGATKALKVILDDAYVGGTPEQEKGALSILGHILYGDEIESISPAAVNYLCPVYAVEVGEDLDETYSELYAAICESFGIEMEEGEEEATQGEEEAEEATEEAPAEESLLESYMGETYVAAADEFISEQGEDTAELEELTVNWVTQLQEDVPERSEEAVEMIEEIMSQVLAEDGTIADLSVMVTLGVNDDCGVSEMDTPYLHNGIVFFNGLPMSEVHSGKFQTSDGTVYEAQADYGEESEYFIMVDNYSRAAYVVYNAAGLEVVTPHVEKKAAAKPKPAAAKPAAKPVAKTGSTPTVAGTVKPSPFAGKFGGKKK